MRADGRTKNRVFLPKTAFVSKNLTVGLSEMLSFLVRTLWIAEEKELVHEIAGLGELREPWHSCQMSWLENHLNLINTYSIALENLDNYRGNQSEVAGGIENMGRDTGIGPLGIELFIKHRY